MSFFNVIRTFVCLACVRVDVQEIASGRRLRGRIQVGLIIRSYYSYARYSSPFFSTLTGRFNHTLVIIIISSLL
jgi:hypothetical protein